MSDDKKRKRPDGGGAKQPHSQQSMAAAGLQHDHEQYVQTPTENDVLFGRGAPIIRWQGNVKFRELIREKKGAYLATRRHAHKDTIAREIIEEIETNRGGRFLKKLDASKLEDDSIAGVSHQWMLVREDLIIEKVKQALRDKDGFNDDTKQPALDRKQKSNSTDQFVHPPKGKLRPTDQLTLPRSGFASADPSQSRPMLASVPVGPMTPQDSHAQRLSELQQRFQAPKADFLSLLNAQRTGQSQQLSGGNADLLPVRGPMPAYSSTNIPLFNEASLLSEIIRQKELQLQRDRLLVAQLAQQLESPHEVPVGHAARLAWLQARQELEAQQQMTERLIQDIARFQDPTGRSIQPAGRLPPLQRQPVMSSLAMTNQAQGQISSNKEDEEHNNDDSSSSSK